MAHKIIWLPDEVFNKLKGYAGMAEFENRIEMGKYVLISDKHQEKMTRKEVALIIQTIVFGLVDTGQADKWAKAFAALGLIEFKKEELKVGLPIGFEFPWNKRDEWGEFIVALHEQGFEINKK